MSALVKTVNAARVAAGVTTLVAPQITGKLAGIGGPPESHLAARLFGAREVALGVATLSAGKASRSALLKLGLSCDLLDIVAALACARTGAIRQSAAAPITTAALAAAAVGGCAIRRMHRDEAWR